VPAVAAAVAMAAPAVQEATVAEEEVDTAVKAATARTQAPVV